MCYEIVSDIQLYVLFLTTMHKYFVQKNRA